MKLIGEILMETKGLSEEALAAALGIQVEKGGRIGEILIRQKVISEDDLLEALGIQFGLTFSPTLPTGDLQTDFTEHVPIQFLKKYTMVPVITEEDTLIAINDPLLFQPIDDLRLLLGLNGTDVVLSSNATILSAINMAYDMSQRSAEQVIEGMHE